tara:strand:+ start:459 stop:608 length:150 start_codon:yes stop_codon:yes gene_type:complete
VNEEEYIQEELAKSKARHPAFRGKIKLSNPDFNKNVLKDLQKLNKKEKK